MGVLSRLAPLSFVASLALLSCSDEECSYEEESSSSHIESISECVREVIWLNFEGFRTDCGELEDLFGGRYDHKHYCSGRDPDEEVVIEGFQGIEGSDLSREEVIQGITAFVRCYFEPLGFEVVTEKPAQGEFNTVNIGGYGNNENRPLALGAAEKDCGNNVHGGLIGVFERFECGSEDLGGPVETCRRLRPSEIIIVILHEIGHALGLNHGNSGIMREKTNGITSCDEEFTAEEAKVLERNTSDFCDIGEDSAERVEAFRSFERCSQECSDLTSVVSATLFRTTIALRDLLFSTPKPKLPPQKFHKNFKKI